jgi:hypothetical protein
MPFGISPHGQASHQAVQPGRKSQAKSMLGLYRLRKTQSDPGRFVTGQDLGRADTANYIDAGLQPLQKLEMKKL